MTKTIAGITDDVIQPYYALEAEFDGGTLRIWTGYGDLEINGDTYTGSGALLSIDGLMETGDLSANNATVSLSGVPSSLISAALTESYQGREARIYFGINGQDPIEVFGGFMDVMIIEETGTTSTISLTIESRLVELERLRPFRYTDESHQDRYPGDTMFSYVSSIQDKKIAWGPQNDGSNPLN